MDRHEILFRDFDLEEHEEKYNQMIDHLLRARELHDEVKDWLWNHPTQRDSQHKFLAGASIKGPFQVMLDRLINSADRYHGGLENMKVRKEKRNVR